MIFRNLDANGDWMFGQGKSNYLTGVDAIGANIKTRLYSWLNDCFFDMGAGIDWTNRLGSKNQRSLLESDLRRVISQSEGVTGISDFYTLLDKRNFTAHYTVETIYSKSYTDTIAKEI